MTGPDPVASGGEPAPTWRERELDRRLTQATEEVARLRSELKRALAGRSEVIGAVSHEFRTPLFAIIGHAELMLDPAFDPDSEQWRIEFGETIKGSADALLDLVNAVLELAEVESQRLELQIRDTDLSAVLPEVLEAAGPVATGANVTLDVDVPADLAPLLADRSRLVQVLVNLVTNAVTYTPPGGTVTIVARASEEKVEVSVVDTGPGIPAELADRVFEPFHLAGNSSDRRGLSGGGLTLGLAKRLIEAHGGQMWFESGRSGGTTFTFVLARADAAAPTARP